MGRILTLAGDDVDTCLWEEELLGHEKGPRWWQQRRQELAARHPSENMEREQIISKQRGWNLAAQTTDLGPPVLGNCFFSAETIEKKEKNHICKMGLCGASHTQTLRPKELMQLLSSLTGKKGAQGVSPRSSSQPKEEMPKPYYQRV